MTGGNPKSTGVYDDVEYSHNTGRARRGLHPGPAGHRR